MKKTIVQLMPGNEQNFWVWYLSHWYATSSGLGYSPISKANLG